MSAATFVPHLQVERGTSIVALLKMEKRNIIVVGTSSGGFDALKRLVSSLPLEFDATMLIVCHLAPNVLGVLPGILAKVSRLPVRNAVHNEHVLPNHIYVAPPDHHMLLQGDSILLSNGPKENRFRPAIDPLFRSAALAYGPRVIGVILTGALDDGAAGLATVKLRGGLAVVQEPSDAEVSSMPERAIEATDVDYKTKLADMGSLLARLVREDAPEPFSTELDDQIQFEAAVALTKSNKTGISNKGRLTPYACPECHGVLFGLPDGFRTRFRCHTGHAFSSDTLLYSIMENIESSLWTALKSLHEHEALLNEMGDHFAGTNQPRVASVYFNIAKGVVARANLVKGALEKAEYPDISNTGADSLNEKD